MQDDRSSPKPALDFEAFLRAGSAPVTYLARDGTILVMNEPAAKNVGLTCEAVKGKSLFTLVPHIEEGVRPRLLLVFDEKQSLAFEDAFRLGDEPPRIFRSLMDPVVDRDGVVIAARVQSWDVTSERTAEAELRAANEKLSVVFEHSPYLILLLGPGGIVNFINRVGPGFRREDVVGGDTHSFVRAQFHEQYDRVLADAFRGTPGRFEFLDVQGTWWDATMVPVQSAGRVDQVISFSVDVTEKRKASEETARMQTHLQDTQKLESLGVLAGGIAHDFNNLLMVIIANTDLAITRVRSDETAAASLDDVMKAAQRAADLCRQMLAYAGRGRFAVQRLDLSRVASEMAKLIEISVSKRVRLERKLADDLPAIEGDPTQIRQVVLNLITNASDAIGDAQGVITFSTRRERLVGAGPTTRRSSQTLVGGEYVVLEVRDTGAGMDEETRSRMFDPFFTTKASGRGLGLSATLGIIRKHGGVIDVESKVGKGTRISVFFPAVDGESVLPTPRPPSVGRGQGLVLVVDDEEAVRKAASQLLQRAGYEVMTAVDGQDALERYDEHHARVSAVLLDLTMPRLNGEQTLRALRERDPKLPVVVMSGYSELEVPDPSVRFLSKPFRAQELIEAIAVALDASR